MSARILCLGNELMADDAFAMRVAARLEREPLPGVEVCVAEEAGFHLLDHVLNAGELLVIDTLETGTAAPGTIHHLGEADLIRIPVGSLHGIGLLDVLNLARELNLAAPKHVEILAVEAADCLVVGGAMHPAVEAAVPKVTALAREWAARRTG